MTVVARPNISGYGSSYGKFGGLGLNDYSASSDIAPENIEQTTLKDAVEFNEFYMQIHDWVMARLGFPTIRVELTAFQIKTAIDEAITEFSYHAPQWNKNFAVFDASAGINIYEIPQFIINGLEYVVYKKSLLSIQSQAGTLEYDFFIRYFQDNMVGNGFQISDFYVMQMHLEMSRKILGQEGSWNIINNQFLQLAPTPVMTPQEVILEYRALDSNTIQPAYRMWIQKYSLAVSKGILGRVLGKHKILPSPGGGASLDGPELREESREEMRELKERLVSEFEEGPSITLF